MARFTYRNKTDKKLTVMNVGEVEPGKTIESDQPISNPNLVLVDGGRMVNVEAPANKPKPGKKG